MLADIVELLGGDERAVRIARKLVHLEMWCTVHEMRWLVASIESVVERVHQLSRAA